jgi:hypothetical protein
MPEEDGLSNHERYRLKDLDGYRKRKAEWARTPEQRAKRTEYMRKWRAANREKHNRISRESHERNKHKHRESRKRYRLMALYGVTPEWVEAKATEQENRCAICRQEKRLVIDHCHKLGPVRGLLCHGCNTKLGWLETHMEAIAAYLGDRVW